MNYSPSPWEVSVDDEKFGVYYLQGNGETPRGTQDKSNAQLISAAPDLLAALEKNVAEYDYFMDSEGDDSPEPEYITESRAAINKAKGF